MDKVNNSPVSTPTILTDIIQVRANIKQKYNALKTGKFETDALINNTFSSIIGPLNEIKSDNKRKPFQTASPPPPVLSESVTPDADSTVNGSLPHHHSASETYKDLNARFGPWTKPVLDKIYGPVKLSDGVFRLGDKELQFFDNADAHPSRVTLKHDVVKTKKIKFHVGDKVRISVYKGVFTKGYLPNWSTEIFTIIKVNKTTPSTFILQDYTGSPIAGGFYAEEIRKTIYRMTMDAFGGSPDSRLNKSIADMEERFEKELATHVNLIEINDAKITALSGEFTKELTIISNITVTDGNKISKLSDENQVNKMKIMHLESTLLASIDKYFSENNNRIESLIKSVDIASKNIQDLKINLTYANTRIAMLEDRVDGYQYSLRSTANGVSYSGYSVYAGPKLEILDKRNVGSRRRRLG
ncbi:hypothetical protein QTP88_015495 [Uroleucon formosanum]